MTSTNRGLVDHQQVAIERIIFATLEAAPFGVDFEQPVDGLGLEACRLGHSLGGAAGRRAQQKLGVLRGEDAQNRPDDCGLADARTAGHDQHLGRQREPDRGDLAFGERKANMLLDPRQSFVGIDPGPRQRAACQPRQPVGDRALCPMQTSQEYAGCFANPVGDHRALLQLKLKRGPDQLLWHLEQLLGQRHQLIRRQAAMTLVHRVGQRIGNPGANPDHRRLLDIELHGDGIGSLEADAPDITRSDRGSPS